MFETEDVDKFGLPVEIGAYEALEKEEAQRIRVYTTRKKYRKFVTVVDGLSKEEAAKTAKELKRRLACGGTAKHDSIVLQGDHKKRVVELLVEMGYSKEKMDIR